MKAVSVFLLFVGMFLVVQGYYSQKLARAEGDTGRVRIKYIPRSLYEEQLSEPTVAKQFKGMFEDVNPWPTMRG